VLNNELLFPAARVETADNAGIRGYRLFNKRGRCDRGAQSDRLWRPAKSRFVQ
jgi:hypothetical protein